MKRLSLAVAALLVPVSFASADEFDFESGLVFAGSEFDSRSRLLTPDFVIASTSVEEESDELSVFGRWYFGGLSDERGPLAQAAFVDRASFVGLRYSRVDSSVRGTILTTDPGLVPAFDSLDSEIDALAVDYRYVQKDSGWFGLAALSYQEVSGAFSDDATSIGLGVGKYLLDTTALEFRVSRPDIGESDPTVYELTFTHLGSLIGSWQYAVDLGYARFDSDDDVFGDTWRTGFSLYPTRRLELGATIDFRDDSDFFLSRNRYEGFLSWFATPSVQVAASYWSEDADGLSVPLFDGTRSESTLDQSGYSFLVNVRF